MYTSEMHFMIDRNIVENALFYVMKPLFYRELKAN